MNETEFKVATIQIAQTFGWRAAHFRPCQTKHGWRTAVEGDGKGYPDLTLVHPLRRLIVFRELKDDRHGLEEPQEQWAQWLLDSGGDWDLWRPKQWDEMVQFLSDGRAKTMTYRPMKGAR